MRKGFCGLVKSSSTTERQQTVPNKAHKKPSVKYQVIWTSIFCFKNKRHSVRLAHFPSSILHTRGFSPLFLPPRRASSGLDKGSFPVQSPPLYGHPLNTDTSLLQTVWLVSGEKKPFNTHTPLIQTFSMAPSVSMLTVFDCTYCLVTKHGNSYIHDIVSMCGPKRCGLL